MIARLQKAMKDKDQGFTLIELLVVIVIIGILAAIAIPLFLNQRQKGVDAGVQSDIKALATLEETWFTDNLAYTDTATDVQSMDYKVTDANVIEAFALADASGFCLRGHSPKGTKDGAAGGGYYWYDSKDGGLSDAQGAGACAGTPTFTSVP